MTEALEAMDMMNNAIVLQNEVTSGQSLTEYLMHQDIGTAPPSIASFVGACPLPGMLLGT